MKNFNVLLTCCSIHVKEMIDCLKNNEDGVDIKVYVANSVAANLPPAELSDGNFVVPPVSAPNYVETLISLCKEYDVSIIMPTATLELEIIWAFISSYHTARALILRSLVAFLDTRTFLSSIPRARVRFRWSISLRHTIIT